MPSSRSPASAVAGHAAFAWASAFGAAHVYWALGGSAGLLGQQMTGALLAINLLAIPLCFFAAFVALSLTRSWTRLVPHRWLLAAAWGAAVLLGLRGGVGLVQSAFLLDDVPPLLALYDAWFLLGGLSFAAVALVHRRS